MHRRRLLQAASASAFLIAGTTRMTMAAQTPVASPVLMPPEHEPLDPRGRQLIARLHELSPLAVLEALETAEVVEPILLDAAGDDAPTALPWHDTSDTDLEHALGGVVVATNAESINSPHLTMLGGYIVYESAEIAYHQLMTRMEELEASMTSTSAAGAKVWIIDEEDYSIGLMRLANVFVIADVSGFRGDIAEGLVMHLDTVTREIA